MIPIHLIQDTETCYLQLWLMLENTRLSLREQYKRYCIRNILKEWFDTAATDDFIWEVCSKAEQLGLNELPLPDVDPRPHRELLRATVATILKTGMNGINLMALDRAYRIAYPDGALLDVNKQRRPP